MKNGALLVDNYDWLSNLNLINFWGCWNQFSVNKMLSLESIKQRLKREQNLSFMNLIILFFKHLTF